MKATDNKYKELLAECYKVMLDQYDRDELNDSEVKLMAEIQALLEGRL